MSVDSQVVQPARKLILAGKLEEAEKLLRSSVDAWAKIHLADLLILRWPFEREKVEEAIRLLEEASKTYRDLGQASIARARALLALAPDPLADALRDKFGFREFRPGQRSIIEAILKGRHALAVQPPGAGRSLLYELAAELLEGATIVVTPQIMDPAESESRRARFLSGELKTLYVDPARLVAQPPTGVRVDLVTVEGAHAVSEGSHEFNPIYLKLREAISRVKPSALLALTPVAAPSVRAEIAEKLGLQKPVLAVGTFDRPNVILEVRAERGLDKVAEVGRLLQEKSGPTVVLTGRTESEEIVSRLRSTGIEAAIYEGGEPPKIRVLVTSRGDIDRSDIRMVIHFRYPLSLEEYYLHVSRAGRDGHPAKAVLLFDPDDKAANRAVIDRSYPDRSIVAQDYESIIGGRAAVSPLAVAHLEAMGYIRRKDGGHELTESAPPVTRIDVTDLERRRRLAGERLAAMERFIEARSCRRRELLQYFGETQSTGWACGGCDRCRPVTPDTKRTPQARDAVLELVRELEPRRLTVNDMARAMLFLGRGLKGLHESDVREILHAAIREGAAEVVPQGQWVRVKRR